MTIRPLQYRHTFTLSIQYPPHTSTHDNGYTGFMQEFNPRLHSLRGLAAMAVVLFHWDSLFPALGNLIGQVEFANTQWYLFMQIRFGWMGVPLFFVLSGYLLGSQLTQRSLSPAYILAFWKRRALRIYPAVWVQLPILLGLGLYFPFLVGNFDYSAGEITRSALLWINLPPWMMAPLNGVWWTLPIELGFYLLLPFIVMIQRKIGWVWTVIGCICITLLWRAGVMVIFAGDNYLKHLPVLDAIPGSLASFAAGFALCFITFKPSAKQRLLLLGALVFVLWLLQQWQIVNNDTYWHGNWILAVWVPLIAITLAAMVFVLKEPIPGCGFLSSGPLVWLGEVSFGIYLWHLPEIGRAHV